MFLFVFFFFFFFNTDNLMSFPKETESFHGERFRKMFGSQQREVNVHVSIQVSQAAARNRGVSNVQNALQGRRIEEGNNHDGLDGSSRRGAKKV